MNATGAFDQDIVDELKRIANSLEIQNEMLKKIAEKECSDKRYII